MMQLSISTLSIHYNTYRQRRRLRPLWLQLDSAFEDGIGASVSTLREYRVEKSNLSPPILRTNCWMASESRGQRPDSKAKFQHLAVGTTEQSNKRNKQTVLQNPNEKVLTLRRTLPSSSKLRERKHSTNLWDLSTTQPNLSPYTRLVFCIRKRSWTAAQSANGEPLCGKTKQTDL